MKWKISEFYPKFGKHIFFELLEEPFATDAGHIGGSIDIDGHICEVLI